jgi:hypothetical protein
MLFYLLSLKAHALISPGICTYPRLLKHALASDRKRAGFEFQLLKARAFKLSKAMGSVAVTTYILHWDQPSSDVNA